MMKNDDDDEWMLMTDEHWLRMDWLMIMVTDWWSLWLIDISIDYDDDFDDD